MRTAIIHHVKTRLLAADSPGAVEEAAAALARGELVAFPTDTVYGLSAGHEHVRKLYGAKDRPKEKRIPVLLSDTGNLEASAIVTPVARALAQRFWPGPLTIVLVAPRRGTMAFRVPDHPLARRLIAASGGGLPVTSANRSGEPDARTAQEVIAQLDGRMIDAASARMAQNIVAMAAAIRSSPPDPLSVPERGDVASSPSPEGRGGQGVRTPTTRA